MFEERVWHPIVPVAVSGMILLAVVQLHGHLEALLPALPLLLLLLSLLGGVYPGCEAIVRLAKRIDAEPRPAGATDQPRPAPPRSHAAGGGLLIAFGLAQRPPPLSA